MKKGVIMKKNELKLHNKTGVMKGFTLIELLVSTYCLYPRKLV